MPVPLNISKSDLFYIIEDLSSKVMSNLFNNFRLYDDDHTFPLIFDDETQVSVEVKKAVPSRFRRLHENKQIEVLSININLVVSCKGNPYIKDNIVLFSIKFCIDCIDFNDNWFRGNEANIIINDDTELTIPLADYTEGDSRVKYDISRYISDNIVNLFSEEIKTTYKIKSKVVTKEKFKHNKKEELHLQISSEDVGRLYVSIIESKLENTDSTELYTSTLDMINSKFLSEVTLLNLIED